MSKGPDSSHPLVNWIKEFIEVAEEIPVEGLETLLEQYKGYRSRAAEESPQTFDRHQTELAIERVEAIKDCVERLQELNEEYHGDDQDDS